ncbi:MAG TPA: non-canonical purine NTP pyrophosphatase [Planctomycetota bacterium]|nr:non-canonical purine NTP pyrophosphatase [Planctomycetota bacterium]
MMRIVVGTRNLKKMREIATILESFPVQLMSLADLPDAPEVEEDADTFEGNARKKALTLADALNEWVIADDSGLEVDALGGRPGVMSARYAGPDATDADKCRKVLDELRGVPREKRTARFRCVIALARPRRGTRRVPPVRTPVRMPSAPTLTGEVMLTAEGRCEGLIAETMTGAGGFGYDPIFYFPPAGRTFGEMTADEKNRVSHRGNALRAFRNDCRALFGRVD